MLFDDAIESERILSVSLDLDVTYIYFGIIKIQQSF